MGKHEGFKAPCNYGHSFVHTHMYFLGKVSPAFLRFSNMPLTSEVSEPERTQSVIGYCVLMDTSLPDARLLGDHTRPLGLSV